MRIMANENVPGAAIDALREQGHDVRWIRTEMPSATDQRILAESVADDRVIITFDKDFGELAFRSKLPATSGIVLFRFRPQSPSYVAKRILSVLQERHDWRGNFSVVEDSRIRVLPLPGVRRA